LKEVKKNAKIKKISVSSGIRHDLIIADKETGKNTLNSYQKTIFGDN
jgi:hypothetical protein